MSVRRTKLPWQTIAKLLSLVALIIAANSAAGWVMESVEFEYRPANEDLVHKIILLSATAYALFIAIPFVPGVEIGLTLIAMFGPPIILLVYLSTIAGLLISFVIGRLLALDTLIALLEDLHFHRASKLLIAIKPMSMDERLTFLVSKTPNRFLPFLLRHRYLALAVVINLPGNIFVGGGGGIAMIAGVSRLYTLPWFLVTIILAVAPVPLAILVFGTKIFSV